MYCTRWAKQELGEIYVPKQELGNEGRASSPAVAISSLVRKTHPTKDFSKQLLMDHMKRAPIPPDAGERCAPYINLEL